MASNGEYCLFQVEFSNVKKKKRWCFGFLCACCKKVNVLSWAFSIAENKILERSHWAVTPWISGLQWKHILGVENLLCDREWEISCDFRTTMNWEPGWAATFLSWWDADFIVRYPQSLWVVEWEGLFCFHLPTVLWSLDNCLSYVQGYWEVSL